MKIKIMMNLMKKNLKRNNRKKINYNLTMIVIHELYYIDSDSDIVLSEEFEANLASEDDEKMTPISQNNRFNY